MSSQTGLTSQIRAQPARAVVRLEGAIAPPERLVFCRTAIPAITIVCARRRDATADDQADNARSDRRPNPPITTMTAIMVAMMMTTATVLSFLH
jgi:hypothetical protein